MERPEAQDPGSIIITGFDPDIVLDYIQLYINEPKSGVTSKIPIDYTIDNTSWRVLNIIMRNAGLSNL